VKKHSRLNKQSVTLKQHAPYKKHSKSHRDTALNIAIVQKKDIEAMKKNGLAGADSGVELRKMILRLNTPLIDAANIVKIMSRAISSATIDLNNLSNSFKSAFDIAKTVKLTPHEHDMMFNRRKLNEKT